MSRDYRQLVADVLEPITFDAMTTVPDAPVPSDDDDLARLRVLRVLMDLVQDEIAREVRSSRTKHRGWGELGAALGVTRQAVQQRFGTRRPDHRVKSRRARQ